MAKRTEITVSGKPSTDVIEQTLIGGDLAPLDPAQRLSYYRNVCESVGLNPLTKPFEYIRLNGKMVLYARKDCTDQLRQLHGVSITKIERRLDDDLYSVTAYAQDKTGRTDADEGVVSLQGLKGEARANAIMKACTKAKRRVTLSLCGLGWLDETEVETVPSAQAVVVDLQTGEIIEEEKPKVVHPAETQNPKAGEVEAKARKAITDLAITEGFTVEDIAEYAGDMNEMGIDELRELYRDVRDGCLRKAPKE